MDPNANVNEQLKLAAEIQAIVKAAAPRDSGSFTEDERARLATCALRMADLIEALDDWIIGTGFLPERWTRDKER